MMDINSFLIGMAVPLIMFIILKVVTLFFWKPKNTTGSVSNIDFLKSVKGMIENPELIQSMTKTMIEGMITKEKKIKEIKPKYELDKRIEIVDLEEKKEIDKNEM
jgi:hypothetical protein